MVATENNRTRRRGMVGHRGLEARTFGYAGRLPVVHPAQTWVELSAMAPRFGRLSVDDLVVIADAVLHTWPEMAADLAAQVHSRTGGRGVRNLRLALPLIRTGSASAMESRARLRFVASGLPAPELNQDGFDNEGIWLGRVDMLWRKQRVIVEYEGDQHRTDRLQWQRDIERVRRLEAAGWKVIR